MTFDWINSEIVLKIMKWIESIFNFFKTKITHKYKKVNKKKIKELMDEARVASVEGNEDKVNKIVDDIHKGKLIDEKVEKS